MSLPEGVKGYEEDAETKALFEEGDRVWVQSHSSLPRRQGTVAWRRWEHGNRCWGYSVKFDSADGGSPGTMAIEAWLSLA